MSSDGRKSSMTVRPSEITMLNNRWNFGKTVSLSANVYQPESEEELVCWLSRSGTKRIRCLGRRHSWSDVIAVDDLALDLRRLDAIRLIETESGPAVRVGAGCQLKRLVAHLNRHGLTLPTLGLIDEQSVAGAIATGTHGSGRHSLSHYVRSLRQISFDRDTGAVKVDEITVNQRDPLWAARCSLGCMGVITEVELPVREQYRIEESFQRYSALEHVLAAESQYELQQFYLVPWQWSYFAQHRRETPSGRSWHASLYRIFWALGMDVGLHLVICSLARWLPTQWTKYAFRHAIPRLIPIGWKVVDRSDRQLTMQHELFRHVEVELFVQRSRLADALRRVREIITQQSDLPPSDQYVHHYPICIRRVLPDNTLISPAAGGDEPWYAISLISYVQPSHRGGFYFFAEKLVRELARDFQARPHWGKFCPVDQTLVRQLYPDWDRFRSVLRSSGAAERFMNRWLEGLLEGNIP
jgi:hypothetical protein